MEKRNRYEKVQDERVIGTMDLLLEFARRIWLIIIMAVVFSILLCGYKYIKDMKNQNVNESVTEADGVEDNLTDEEAEQVEEAKRIVELLENQTEYAENSILMQLDAYNVSRVSTHFLLSLPENEQETETSYDKREMDLKSAYYDYISNGALLSDLKDLGVETEQKYLREIISFESSIGDEDVDYQGNSFDVKVEYYEKEPCMELADQITQCILNYQDILSQRLYAHTISEISQSYSEIVDDEVSTAQTECNDQILALKENVKTLKAELNENQLMLLEQESQQEDTIDDKEATTSSGLQISKKYICLGGAIGIVLACIYIIIAYLLRGTINSVKDIRYIYNKRVLAELTISKQNRFYLFCRRKLLKSSEILTTTEEVELLTTNIKNRCKSENINKILLSFAGEKENILPWLSTVENGLKADGIQIVLLDHGLENAEAVEQMNRVKEIVLIEKMFETRYETFTREMEICMEQDMQVLGVVALK